MEDFYKENARGRVLKILKDFALSHKQGLVYISLLEMGESYPSIIAKRTGIKRANVYFILDQLIERGIVSYVKKKSATSYTALDPSAFVDDQARKFHDLQNALPDLMSLKQRFSITPQMAVFEGEEGIIRIMEDTLEADGEIYCWSSGALAMDNEFFKNYHAQYVAKKNKRKIWIRGLFQYDEVGLALKRKEKTEKREVYLIPTDKFPFENEINIYNDKISIISHKDKVGVIIQNEAIANTQKSIFRFAFEYAKLLEPQILSKEHKAEFGYV